ncbi:unnamed protein product, partial [Heterosigma akashiwo]
MPDQGERKFTEEEVRWTVMRRRGFKAPGPDMLFGRVLMEAGELLLPHLLVLYNACLALGYFPVFWKRDLEIALAKLGKAAYDVAKAYRLICLLCEIGKDLEGLMDRRMRWKAENEGWLHPRQDG